MGSTLFPFDTSKSFSWAGGVLAIVSFGVGLTFLADGDLAKDPVRAEADSFAIGQARLEALAREVDHLRALDQERISQRAVFEELRTQITKLGNCTLEEQELAVAVALEQEAIRDLVSAQERHALAYRAKLWDQAKGRTLPELRTKDGKTYRSVEIREVGLEGVEIRHETGAARLSVRLLAEALRREWQLDLAESQRLLRERCEAGWEAMRTKQEKRLAAAEARSGVGELPSGEEGGDRVELMSLLEENRILTARLVRLRTELSEAANRVAYSRQRSVPGSLETWAEREEHLRLLQARLQTHVQQTRGRIRLLSPGQVFLPDW